MSANITGSCLCKAVKYTITGRIKAAANCHCNTCKMMTGGAFSSLAIVGDESFRFDQGEGSLSAYQVSEQATRHFCRICGTPLFNVHQKFPGNHMVALGSLDDPTAATPAVNVYCESMLSWVKDICGLSCFEKEYQR